MFSFLKKSNVTPKEIGDGLFFKFFLKSMRESDDQTLKLIPREKWERADSELIYLRVVAIDYGVKWALGKSSRTEEILRVFYEHLESMITAETFPNKYFEKDLNNRFLAYGHAAEVYSAKDSTNLPFISEIGSKFCELCGIQDDPEVSYHAAVIFGLNANIIRDLVKGL
jgi:hypothetical protein